jgi:voltage-gated potassium channel Kch
VVLFSYSLYILERSSDYQDLLDEVISKEHKLNDYIWLIVVTLMTVGYGDMSPSTHGGRFIAILSSIGGLFLTATLIGVINNSVELSYTERNVITFLNNYQLYD